MFLHYLLVVLVVLLGNFQVISSDTESLLAHDIPLSKSLTIEPYHINHSTSQNDEDSVFHKVFQYNSHDGQPTTNTLKVTDLHDPFNILERINKTDTVHSHSITSEDFAQLTSLTNKTVKDKSPSDQMIPTPAGNGDEDNLYFLELPIPVQDIPTDEYKLLQDLPVNTISTNIGLVEEHDNLDSTMKITDFTGSPVDSINETNNGYSVPNVIDLSFSEDYYDEPKNDATIPYPNINFTDIVSKATLDIKMYSNEAVMDWEDLKERVSSGNEISHVLNDYHDKIAISQAVNRSECVRGHVEKYESRMRFLKDVTQSCESQLKREKWLELQNKTKEILSGINEIARETYQAIENLQTDAVENDESIKLIENEGKQKLQWFDIDSKKNILSELKKISLNNDEDDYRDCIIRNTGHEVVVDTLNDIMKIKNNCVG